MKAVSTLLFVACLNAAPALAQPPEPRAHSAQPDPDPFHFCYANGARFSAGAVLNDKVCEAQGETLQWEQKRGQWERLRGRK